MFNNPYKAKYKKKKPKVVGLKAVDDLWSLAVKHRAGFNCELCGSTACLNSHHIYSRSHWGLRFDLDNGICLCFKHHKFAHLDSLEFIPIVIRIRGQAWHNTLLLKKQNSAPNLDFEMIKITLNADIESRRTLA